MGIRASFRVRRMAMVVLGGENKLRWIFEAVRLASIAGFGVYVGFVYSKPLFPRTKPRLTENFKLFIDCMNRSTGCGSAILGYDIMDILYTVLQEHGSVHVK